MAQIKNLDEFVQQKLYRIQENYEKMNGQSLEKEKEILALIEKNSQENLIISKQIEKFQNLLKEDEKKNSQNNILVHGEIDQMNEKMMNINKKIESLENIASVKNQRGSIIPKKKTIDE